MKYFITSIVCVAVGIGIGWYFGYSSPATKHQELLKKYQRLEEVKSKDEWLLGLFARKALEEVEKAGTNQPEQFVYLTIGEYYYELRRDQYNGWDVGDTNIIAQIEAASLRHPLPLAIKK